MNRTPHLTALLARYGIEPCGDGSCMFGRAGGMHTNGGCRCIGSPLSTEEALRTARIAQRLAAIIRELDQQPEQIAAWLEGVTHVHDAGKIDAEGRWLLHALAADVRAGRWKERG